MKKVVCLPRVSAVSVQGVFGQEESKRHASRLGTMAVKGQPVDVLLDDDSTVIHFVDKRAGIVYSCDLEDMFTKMFTTFGSPNYPEQIR